MTTAQIKQSLHNYIDTAEDNKLKAIYTLLQEDIPGDYILSEAQMAELDRRLANHEAGIGQSFSFKEGNAR